MSLTDGNGMIMPVAPSGGIGGGGWGDGIWLILLVLFAIGGGGFGFGGFGGAGVGGLAADGAMLYPWMNQSQQVNDGFRDQMLNSNINQIQTGVNGIATQLCNGFAGVNATVNSGFANAETAANARQIANMQTQFAGQNAMNQGFNGLQSQLASCCCENRLATNDLKYTIAQENCNDRQVLSDGIKDILTATQAQTQAILNQLCSDKIEQKNDTIAQLRSELMYARGQASQDVQTAAIQAGQRALANEVEQYVLPTPRPAYIVANPNCCVCGM